MANPVAISSSERNPWQQAFLKMLRSGQSALGAMAAADRIILEQREASKVETGEAKPNDVKPNER